MAELKCLKSKFDEESTCETKVFKVDTSPQTYRMRQTWRIENFHAIREHAKVGQRISSNVFGDRSGSGCSWCITLYPRGYNEAEKEYVGANLSNAAIAEGFDAPTGRKFEMTIVDNDGKILGQVSSPLCGSGWRKLWKFVSTESTKTISIVCEIEFASKNVGLVTTAVTAMPSVECDVKPPRREEKPSTAVVGSLLAAIGGLRSSKQLCDFTIVVGGGRGNPARQFPVHRAILAAQSMVFAEMFEHELEVDEGPLGLDGVSTDAIDALLDFLYTGTCAATLSRCATELLKLAQKYAIASLKALCEAHLCAGVVVSNVGECYALGKVFAAEQLQATCSHVFSMHKKAVLLSAEWKAFRNEMPLLAVELFELDAMGCADDE